MLQKEGMQNIPFLFNSLPGFCIFILFPLKFVAHDLVLNFIMGWHETQSRNHWHCIGQRGYWTSTHSCSSAVSPGKIGIACSGLEPQLWADSLQEFLFTDNHGNSAWRKGTTQWQYRIKCELALDRITILLLNLPSWSTNQNRPRALRNTMSICFDVWIHI